MCIKKDISSDSICQGGQHDSNDCHSEFSLWFFLGGELVKSCSSGFPQWAGSRTLLFFAIFTCTPCRRPVNCSVSWFLYWKAVECLENVLWKANPCGSWQGYTCLVTHPEKGREMAVCSEPPSPGLRSGCGHGCMWVWNTRLFARVDIMYFYLRSYCGFRGLSEWVL